MLRNDALPRVEVDKESFAVTVDGKEATVPAATSVPLSRRYLLV
jgi:urease alpha subunit